MKELVEKFEANGGKWKNFKIGELFISSNGDFDIQKKHLGETGNYVVSSGLQNLGIIGKSSIKAKIFKPNTITVDMFGNAFFRDFEYKMVTHARVFSLSSDIIKNSKLGLYLTGQLAYLNKIYTYDNMASWAKIKDLTLILPYRNNKIDFKFMEEYICEIEKERICELEQERILELKNYLKAGKLDDYKLTNEEQNLVDLINKNKVAFKNYKIKDIFKLTSSKKKFNANSVKFGGKYPYVARTSLNNGIKDYLTEDEKFLNPAKTISFGQDTATIFYQEKPYFTGDKIKILEFLPKELNLELASFLLTAMNKSFESFEWGQSSFNENILNNTEIKLPIKNDKIDYMFIDTYITAVKKLVIKDVIDKKDKIIKTTKNICSK